MTDAEWLDNWKPERLAALSEVVRQWNRENGFGDGRLPNGEYPQGASRAETLRSIERHEDRANDVGSRLLGLRDAR